MLCEKKESHHDVLTQIGQIRKRYSGIDSSCLYAKCKATINDLQLSIKILENGKPTWSKDEEIYLASRYCPQLRKL